MDAQAYLEILATFTCDVQYMHNMRVTFNTCACAYAHTGVSLSMFVWGCIRASAVHRKRISIKMFADSMHCTEELLSMLVILRSCNK